LNFLQKKSTNPPLLFIFIHNHKKNKEIIDYIRWWICGEMVVEWWILKFLGMIGKISKKRIYLFKKSAVEYN